MEIELGKYYLLKNGNVAIVEQDKFAECPIFGYGAIGSVNGFETLGNIDLTFEEAKKEYGERCVGVKVYQHGTYSLCRDDEDPDLFIIYDESVGSDCQFVKSSIEELEHWLNGYIYEVNILDDKLVSDGGWVFFGISDDYSIDGVVCDVDLDFRYLKEMIARGAGQELINAVREQILSYLEESK